MLVCVSVFVADTWQALQVYGPSVTDVVSTSSGTALFARYSLTHCPAPAHIMEDASHLCIHNAAETTLFQTLLHVPQPGLQRVPHNSMHQQCYCFVCGMLLSLWRGPSLLEACPA